MSENLLTLTIDGHEVKASADSSIIQAYAHAGSAITANVGCMGQGVCGSCRCMIRKEGEREVTTALACKTKVEEGMQVSFLDYFIPEHIQYYDVSEVATAGTGWTIPPKPFLKRKTAVIAAAVIEPVLKVCKWKTA